MALTRTTEVRKISSTELIKIATILSLPSSSPAWKKLMLAIPFELTSNEHLSEEGQKYNYQHIRLIENAVPIQKRPAAQIFLDEWSTSGRVRPTLGHLLQLLVKSELFRAADYVAINLLNESLPQRPSTGPAAKVDIDLPLDNSRTMNLNRDDSETHPIRSPLASLMLSEQPNHRSNHTATERTVLSSNKSPNTVSKVADAQNSTDYSGNFPLTELLFQSQ